MCSIMKSQMIYKCRTVKFRFWEKLANCYKGRHCHSLVKLTALCLWITSLASCMYEQTVIKLKSDAIKWEGRDTGIRKQLNIDGFFYHDSFRGDTCVHKGNPQEGWGICFFDDGTYVHFHKWNQDDNKGKDLFWIYFSGVYTLSHDTIIVESFNRLDFPEFLWKGINVRYPHLRRLKIIDRNTLEEIDSYYLRDDRYYNAALIRSYGKYLDIIPDYDKKVYHFSDSFVFPTSDIKMKKKSWLWANEGDWKEWMIHWEEQKKTKKTYKIKYYD